MEMVMVRDLYQSVAEEVRREIQTNIRRYPLVRNPITLKGGCQNTAYMVYERLKQLGKLPKILKLHYARGDGTEVEGSHIVADDGNTLIDPAITQFFPKLMQYAFDVSEYPLKILKVEDITDSSFWNKV